MTAIRASVFAPGAEGEIQTGQSVMVQFFGNTDVDDPEVILGQQGTFPIVDVEGNPVPRGWLEPNVTYNMVFASNAVVFTWENVFEVEVTASRDLAIADNRKVLESKNGATEVVIHIVTGLPKMRLSLIRIDDGAFTMDPSPGVLLNGAENSISIALRYQATTLYRRGVDEWIATA